MTDETIPGAWVTAGIEAVIAHRKRKREVYWDTPSSEDVRVILAGVAPLIAAAEFERIRGLAERRHVIGVCADGTTGYFTRIMREEAPGA